MKQKYITIQEHNKLINRFNSIRNIGVCPVMKTNKFKVIAGVSLISLSFILPFEFGLFAFLGCYIMGLSLFDIKNKYFPEYKRILKNKVLRR